MTRNRKKFMKTCMTFVDRNTATQLSDSVRIHFDSYKHGLQYLEVIGVRDYGLIFGGVRKETP